MVLWKLYQKAGKRNSLPAHFKESLFNKPEFEFKMPNIATNYETACWMLREGIVENNPNKWGHLISKSHRDFNDYWTRTMLTRCGLFLTACWVFSCFYTKPRFDWQDYHEPKFEQKTYGDLEEGGDEGGDDD